MQASSLSVDEFASLVAAALQEELDVGANRGIRFGGNNRLTDYHERHPNFEEHPQPTPTRVHVKRPSLFNWRFRKSKYRTLSDSLCCTCRASSFTTEESYTDYCSKSNFEFPASTLCNTLHPTGGMVAFAGDPSPTVLAASMSTVNLGANCLGLVAGGGCGSICGASPVSRNGSPTRTTRNLNGNVPNSSGVAVVVPPTIPILMFEPDTDAGPNRSPYDIGLDGNVIDLSSTLQLPRTPSPSPRTAWQPREPISPPPRTPRKSFLAKLRSLSSKGSNDSSSASSSPHISTSPMPTLSPSSPNSKNPHIDSNNSVPRASPTGLFNLHLPFPLTPISLSKPNSPNHSRSPSPKPPYRRVSALSKRESAPVFSASYAPDGRVLPTNQGSPIYSADSGQDVKTADKRRIQSLYGSAPVPRLPTSRKEPSEKATVNEERRSAESMLSLADCLEGKTGSGERQSNVKEKRESIARGGSNEARQETQNTQPFPSKEPFSSSELEGMSSEPSNKSCESASRSPHGHMRTRSMREGTKRSTGEKGMTFPVGASVDPAISQLSVQGRNGLGEPEQPGEDQIFAPFVPLVLQHERLQQKLKKPVPLASFEGAREVEGVGIKSVVVGPFPPPRSTSLSSASIQIRQRTKSAPSAPLSLPLTKSNSKLKDKAENISGIPPVPSLPPHIASASATTPTTLRYQLPPTHEAKKRQKLKRPTTAPATSMPDLLKGTATEAVPFPVLKEAEANVEGDQFANATRQRKTSKLFEKMRARKSLPPPLQPSSAVPASVPVVNLNEAGENDPTSSGKGSVGLRYSLSMSKHPYAKAQPHLGGVSSSLGERTEMVKPKLRTSVSFLPSSSDSHGRQAPTSPQRRAQTHAHTNALQTLTPSSPSSPTASNSGSEASTKSPVTPRSPFWSIGAGGPSGSPSVIAIGGVRIRSGMGLGILGSSPVQSGEEGSGNELGKRRSEVDTSAASDGKKNYHMHPYSRPYTQTNIPFTAPAQIEVLATNNTNDAVRSNEQAVHPNDASASSPPVVKRRPSKQAVMQNGLAVPTKPPPVGPLPLPPSNDKDSGSETDKLGAKKVTQRLSVAVENEIPDSPVPSEYLKAFSVPPTPNLDDVEDETASMSQPYGCHKNSPSDARSQSSESYEHDTEYEALLAANTMANVGVLASMRNIGVGRKLMSAHHEPSLSERLSPSGRQRKRAGSEATRNSLVGTEWTLFLGNDGTPSRSMGKDVLASLTSATGAVGIRSLDGVRARTKSESALNSFAFGDKTPKGIKRVRSSTTSSLAGPPHLVPGRSSPPPPVPKLPKRRYVEKSEDWTLSLPLLPPEENENLSSSTMKSKDTTRISEPVFASPSTTTLAAPGNDNIARSSSKRSIPPRPEIIVCVEGVPVEDDGLDADVENADESTVAGSPVDDTFEIELDSLGLDDEDDSEPESPVETGIGGLPTTPLLFSVPRVVSKGSGMECATWGDEEIKDSIRKKGRRLSDGLEGLMGMGGVSVRLSVNADGESICVMDEQTEDAESEDGKLGEPSEGPPMTDAMKENLAKLDALSADLKRLNDLLKQGVGENRIDLKHARSCVLLPSQRDVGQFQADPHIRVQQSVDALRSQGPHPVLIKSSTGVNVKEKVKSWTERSASLSSPSHLPIASSGNASNPTPTKIRPPLPFAPPSAPGFPARSLNRNTGSGSHPSTTQGVGGHRHAAPGRSLSLSMATTPASIASTIPVGVVGSGLKVGGNGRVISLSTTSSAPPPIPIGNAQLGLKVMTSGTDSKGKRSTIVSVQLQGKDDEDTMTVSKRDSASSSTSTDTFFSSFSSSTPAPTPPPDKRTLNRRRAFSTSDRSSGSDSSTPTRTILPCLTIVTLPSGPSSESHSPINDVHTPSSSAMPTPLASSFPFPPPLPGSVTSLGEDLNTVSKILATTRRAEHQATSSTAEYSVPFSRSPRPVNPDASRLSSASVVSVQTIVPDVEHRTKPRDSITLVSEVEVDTESTYSGSFYSARSSFEA